MKKYPVRNEKNQEAKMIRKIRFREVTEKIQGWIIQRIIPTGERLPAERKLAADLNVSRAAIRESFLLLEEKGYIEIKRGVKKGGLM